MEGHGHSAVASGGRLAVRAGSASAVSRLVSFAAPLALHVFAIAGILSATGIRTGASDARQAQVTVVALPSPPPPDHPAPRRGASLHPMPSARLSPPMPPASMAQAADLPVSARAAPPAQAEARDTASPPEMPPSSGKGPDQTLPDYQAAIWRHIAEHRPRGIQAKGSAVIDFRIDRNGQLLASKIVRSSGNLNLDRIATRLIRQASPFPRPPEWLAADQLVFVVPINFE